MDHPIEDRKAVFLSEDCRQAFGQPQYTTLTKKREIRTIIRDGAISVADFSEHKLVAILYYLIRQGVFLAEASIHREFPDLELAAPRQNAEGNTSAGEQILNIRSYIWLESLLKNSQYSDLILTSNEKNYAAHRVVVCSQSSVIDKKCQFRDTTQHPLCDSCGAAPKYRFDFMDDDPQSVDCLIQYLYCQDYQNPHGGHEDEKEHGKSTENPDEIKLSDDCVDDCYPVFHVRVYALAEKYDIPALRRLALDKFDDSIQQGLSLDRFLESAEEAYTSTIPEDRGVRDSVVKHFHTHPELLDDDRTQETIQRMNSLMYDLLMYWHGEYTTQP